MTFPVTNADLIRRLADAFKACPIEAFVTYEQLSRAIGEPIQAKLYLAHKAMGIANAECAAIFVNERNIGYRRLPHDEAHGLAAHARVRGRRIFHRASKKVSNVLVMANDMSNAARLKAFAEQAALGLLIHMTYDRNRPKIRETSAAPPTQEVVRAGIEAMRAARAARFDRPPA